MTDKHDEDRQEPVADSAEPIAYGGISPEAKAKAEQLEAKLAAALDAAPLSASVAYERAAECCTDQLGNVSFLFYDPPQSFAARDARAAIRASSIRAADLLKAALALPDLADAEKALKDALTYIDKGHHGMARNIIAAALARLKGSQP